ncbi:MAG: aminotransferase class III-fold pyridoxal phosphate-dependent enzyme [Maribacter sp.]
MEGKLNISAVLSTYYSIDKPTISKMEGYDSINFKVSFNSIHFVLKVYPNSENHLEWVQAEDSILENLSAQNLNCSKVIPTSDGAFQVIEEDYIYRLLSFVEGHFLSEVTHTDKLLQSFGSFLGTMDTSLKNLSNLTIKAKETAWDLKHFQKSWMYLSDITDSRDRNLVSYFCLQFTEHVVPLQYELRQCIIHNDANDWNILVNNEEITGIIDFGDMCHSCLINELGIALTYVLMDKENPLRIAEQVISAYHVKMPLKQQELDILYYLIAARLCTSVLNSAHSKKLKPESDYITISEKPAWALLKKWIAINPTKAKNSFRKACGFIEEIPENLEDQLIHRKKNTSGSLSLSYKKPIQMQGAAFQYMYDANGNTFLDAYNNIMQVGHCHPKVVQAGQKTMAKLNTNTRYIYNEFLTYTDKLLAKFPHPLNKVFLVNSGSAASDLAIRIAKTHTQRKKVMVMEHGYHGNTQNGIEISHYKYHHKGGEGKPEHILEAELPKFFNSGFTTEEEASQHFVNLAKKQIDKHPSEIAAFIAEPIVGCGGQVPLSKGYLKQMYSLIRNQGGVCISDEVQVGFGRLGSHFWGFEMHDVLPDIVVLGKPMGNGHPIGAVITTAALANSFNNGMEFFSSFGGNPVSCAIGEAVLDVMEEDGLQQHAKKVGTYLKEKLKNLQADFSELADIRGSGLFLGVEILDLDGNPNTVLAAYLKNELRLKHILISTDGPFDNVLKIKPPLYFNENNADQLLHEMNVILKKHKKN